MSQPQLFCSDQHPSALNVLGEQVTIFGQDDASKPFEVHLQEGVQGGGPPPHHHPWDEAFYVLQGQVLVTMDGHEHLLDAGSFVHVPAGTIHAYTNQSTPTRLLAIVSDCSGGQVFKQMDQHVKQLPEDLPKVVEVGAKHGVVFVD